MRSHCTIATRTGRHCGSCPSPRCNPSLETVAPGPAWNRGTRGNHHGGSLLGQKHDPATSVRPIDPTLRNQFRGLLPSHSRQRAAQPPGIIQAVWVTRWWCGSPSTPWYTSAGRSLCKTDTHLDPESRVDPHRHSDGQTLSGVLAAMGSGQYRLLRCCMSRSFENLLEQVPIRV